MNAGTAVKLDKVAFSYGEAPLSFDVEFAAGVITAVMGPSGSGKSTLLNLVAGFETPQAGAYGSAERTSPPRRRPSGRCRWCSRKTTCFRI